MPDTCEPIEDERYGCIIGYRLEKGHTLSVGKTDYVFSVRVLQDGNYSRMLKAANGDPFTATEDMTVGMLIRKPDFSAMTAEDLAAAFLYDTQYGMKDVSGLSYRFTVDAATIDGKTEPTPAAIFLPETYGTSGAPTPLLIMTNGYHSYLTDSEWNANTPDDVGVMRFYLQNGYAVLVVDNTAHQKGSTPDWGNPQLVDSYWKAYAHVQACLRVEERFSLHSRSAGTFAAIRIMREHPELIKCALLCGPVLSLESRFGTGAAFLAQRFGFTDKSGATYEADKVVGYDPYTDVNGEEYDLPPTFWMLAETDAIEMHLSTIRKIREHGNDVTLKIYTETDHSGVCRLNVDVCQTDALAYLEAHRTSDAEHRFGAWSVTEPTCKTDGSRKRVCADCGQTESVLLPATGIHRVDEATGRCADCKAAMHLTQVATVSLQSGQFNDTSGSPISDNTYGCVIGYSLKAGQTLSISDLQYVFAVRKQANGNYLTLLRAATSDPFTATEDMLIAVRVRKPDHSVLTAAELAAVKLTVTEWEADPELLPGDLNGDGGIDATDYLTLKKHILETLSYELNDAQLKAADYNGDGEIDAVDYIALKKAFLADS